MPGLENLKTRLSYQGGNAEGRFQKDKLQSLRKALLYSYQAETAIFPDGRKFRCLINSDKLNTDYDNKILSIPYEDIDLNNEKNEMTAEGITPTDIKVGDVFEWERTGTFWIIYLQYLEEDSYFRAEIRRCKGEIEVNGKTYKVYLRGPAETEIQWNQKHNTSWNDLNYSLVAFVPKNEDTIDYFHRFTKIKIAEDETGKVNTWEVATVNPYYGDGIIKICLNESYNNEMADVIKQESTVSNIENNSDIEGKKEVYPYDIVSYEIKNNSGGNWYISDNKKANIIKKDDTSVTIEITTGRSGNFDLIYRKENKEIIFPIIIKSL
jgi:hypothetical protein